MPVKCELPAKIGRCSKKLAGHNFDRRAKLWPANFSEHLFCFFSSRNKGQLRAAVTGPCRLPTPLCRTYSELSGNEDLPGIIQNIPNTYSKVPIQNPYSSQLKVLFRASNQDSSWKVCHTGRALSGGLVGKEAARSKAFFDHLLPTPPSILYTWYYIHDYMYMV